MIIQGVALSSPVSTLQAWNARDYDPPFGDEQRLAFYDSGFPTEARKFPREPKTEARVINITGCVSGSLGLRQDKKK